MAFGKVNVGGSNRFSVELLASVPKVTTTYLPVVVDENNFIYTTDDSKMIKIDISGNKVEIYSDSISSDGNYMVYRNSEIVWYDTTFDLLRKIDTSGNLIWSISFANIVRDIVIDEVGVVYFVDGVKLYKVETNGSLIDVGVSGLFYSLDIDDDYIYLVNVSSNTLKKISIIDFSDIFETSISDAKMVFNLNPDDLVVSTTSLNGIYSKIDGSLKKYFWAGTRPTTDKRQGHLHRESKYFFQAYSLGCALDNLDLLPLLDVYSGANVKSYDGALSTVGITGNKKILVLVNIHGMRIIKIKGKV